VIDDQKGVITALRHAWIDRGKQKIAGVARSAREHTRLQAQIVIADAKYGRLRITWPVSSAG